MERLLFSEMYANKAVCEFKMQYIEGQKGRFERNIAKNGIGIYCKNSKLFATQLHNAKNQNFGSFKLDTRIKHLCRLSLLPVFPYERNECHYCAEQKNLCLKMGKKTIAMITPYPYSGNGSIVDVFAQDALDAPGWCTVYNALAEYIAECHKVDIEEQFMGYSMAQPLQELFTNILGRFINPALSPRFSAGTSPLHYPVSIFTSNSWRKWVMNVRGNLKDVIKSPSRICELEALLKLLNRKRGQLSIVTMSNIRLYTADGKSEVEWDGGFITIQKDNIILYLIEAKKRHSRRSREPRTQLLESLEKNWFK